MAFIARYGIERMRMFVFSRSYAKQQTQAYFFLFTNTCVQHLFDVKVYCVQVSVFGVRTKTNGHSCPIQFYIAMNGIYLLIESNGPCENEMDSETCALFVDCDHSRFPISSSLSHTYLRRRHTIFSSFTKNVNQQQQQQTPKRINN